MTIPPSPLDIDRSILEIHAEIIGLYSIIRDVRVRQRHAVTYLAQERLQRELMDYELGVHSRQATLADLHAKLVEMKRGKFKIVGDDDA